MKNKIRHNRYLNNEMTQKRLAELAGVTRQTIIAIEKGAFNPSVKLALKLAHIFECKIEELFQLDPDD